MSDFDFDQFVATCEEEFEAKQHALAASHHLRECSRDFRVDLVGGKLHFSDSGQGALECEVSLIGSFVAEAEEWQWAWANRGLPAGVSQASASLKDLAAITQQEIFGDPKVGTDEQGADMLLAVACHHLGAVGGFVASGNASSAYLVIHSVRVVAPITQKTRSSELTNTDSWVGTYSTDGDDEASPFLASFQQRGAALNGQIEDELGIAEIEGTLRGTDIVFTKRYQHPARAPVAYAGTFDAALESAEGTWALEHAGKRLTGTWDLALLPWWKK
jgi:hypothetical protein